jgi:hypothetical protein
LQIYKKQSVTSIFHDAVFERNADGIGPISQTRMKFFTTDEATNDIAGQYWIDTERRVRTEEYRGVVTLEDLKTILDSMTSDPCWSADFHSLVDFSEAKLELSSNDILRFALLLRQEAHRSTGWLAYVATDSLTYGVVRMLGYWSRSSERLRIFQSRPEAECWLRDNRTQLPPRFIQQTPAPTAEIRHVI